MGMGMWKRTYGRYVVSNKELAQGQADEFSIDKEVKWPSRLWHQKHKKLSS